MAEVKKTCDICGKDWIASRKHEKYCSKECRVEARRRQYRRDPISDRICEACGSEYQPSRSTQKQCSPCSQRVRGISGVQENDDGSRTITTKPSAPKSWTPEELLKAHGMDPADWEVVRVRGNRWGEQGDPNVQLRIDAVPRRLLIDPPDAKAYKPPKAKRKPKGAPRLAMVISDHHAPHHHKGFHETTLAWLADNQPDLIEVNGDLLDFPTLSRYRDRDGFTQSARECLEGGYSILRDYRETCPNAEIRFKLGNHDQRLIYTIIDNAPALHQLTPAGDEVPALDLRRLLHLDALQVEFIPEEWDQAKTRISPKLTARHGVSTSNNATKVLLDKLSGSTIQGHSHRLAMSLKTEYEGEDEQTLSVRMGIEGGCACVIPGGLGYVAGGQPQWVNAFAVFHVHDDGDFSFSPAIFVNDRLLAPGGHRYSARKTQ